MKNFIPFFAIILLCVGVTGRAAFTNTYNAAANQINLPIPSSGTGGSGNLTADQTFSRINIANSVGGALVRTVTVTLNINHTADSDLVVSLINPDGVTNVLVRNVVGKNFSNTTFDDSATLAMGQGTAPYIGTFQPLVPLSVLAGGLPNGTWTLQIEDQASGDFGTLLGWSLTIVSDLPQITINDTAPLEGNSGTANAAFSVRLAPASSLTVTAKFATTNGTATSPTDYTATSGILTFNPGDTIATILVPIKGNTTPQPNKTFFVNLSSPTNGVVADGQGRATIINDDPAVTNTYSAGAGQTNLSLPPFGTGGSGDPVQDTTVSTIVVNGFPPTQVIAAVQVTANVMHTDIGDLIASLVAPDGTSIPLFTRVGEGSANFSNTVFDDQAATPIELGTGPFTGSYRPQGSLCKCLSRCPNGSWSLQITDAASSDSGRLGGWSLKLVTITVPTLTVSSTGGNTVLSWPTNFVGYSADFMGSINSISWTPTGVAPIPSGGVFTLTIPATSNARFFRLRNP